MATEPYQPPDNLKSRLKESYDAIAPIYNEWAVKHSFRRLEFLDKLLQALDVPRSGDAAKVSILELGCGAGVPVTKKLTGLPGVHVIANDISSAQLAAGKAALGSDRVDWREGDMMALDFPEGSLDGVLGFYSVIHLPREEQEVLLGKILRWLKPGGFMMVNFSAEAMEGSVIDKWLHEEGWMFWSGWGADVSLQKVKQAGFEVVFEEIAPDEVDANFLWVLAKRP